MKKIECTRWQASDGKMFDKQIDCFHHEFLKEFEPLLLDKIDNIYSESTIKKLAFFVLDNHEFFSETLLQKKKILEEVNNEQD